MSMNHIEDKLNKRTWAVKLNLTKKQALAVLEKNKEINQNVSVYINGGGMEADEMTIELSARAFRELGAEAEKRRSK